MAVDADGEGLEEARRSGARSPRTGGVAAHVRRGRGDGFERGAVAGARRAGRETTRVASPNRRNRPRPRVSARDRGAGRARGEVQGGEGRGRVRGHFIPATAPRCGGTQGRRGGATLSSPDAEDLIAGLIRPPRIRTSAAGSTSSSANPSVLRADPPRRGAPRGRSRGRTPRPRGARSRRRARSRRATGRRERERRRRRRRRRRAAASPLARRLPSAAAAEEEEGGRGR